MPTKAAVLKILRETDFPENKGRKNNLQPNQKFSFSMVLGQSKLMFCSKDKDKGRGCRRPSRHNKKHAKLLEAAKQLLKSHAPNYAFHSVTIKRCRFLYDPFVFYMTPFDFKKLVFFLFVFSDRWVLDTIAWVLA